MKEPTFDADGYPTDETLNHIKAWDIKVNEDFEKAMDFAGAAWKYPDRWEKSIGEAFGRPVLIYAFSTGGWSGNESIVSAIEGNLMLQMVGAHSWLRGGHYEYHFPIKETDGSA